MAAESLFKVRFHVSFGEFAEALFFCRGESLRCDRINRPLGLRGKEIAFTNYDRLLVYGRFKEEAALQDGSTRRNFEPGSVMLKVFQNVPEVDLEVLFPNIEVRMKTVDKLAISVPAAAHHPLPREQAQTSDGASVYSSLDVVAPPTPEEPPSRRMTLTPRCAFRCFATS